MTGQGGNRNVVFRIPTPTFGAGLIEAIPDSVILANLIDRSAPASVAWASAVIPTRSRRQRQPQRQRRHHHAFRLEGTEQVAADVRRRGLQRRDGNLQRAVPAGARRDGELSGWRNRAERLRSTSRTRPIRPRQPRCSRTSRRLRSSCACSHRRSRLAPTPSTQHGRRAVRERRLRAVPHAGPDAPDLRPRPGVRRLPAPRCPTSRRSCTRICWCITWARGWRMASPRAGPARMSSARRRCGGSGSGCSSCTTGAPANLIQAIQFHASQGSEANQIVQNFAGLSPRDQQDLINFLRSLCRRQGVGAAAGRDAGDRASFTPAARGPSRPSPWACPSSSACRHGSAARVSW